MLQLRINWVYKNCIWINASNIAKDMDMGSFQSSEMQVFTSE